MKKEKRKKRFSGHSLSPGLAIGSAFLYRDIWYKDFESHNIEEHEVKEELRRIRKAMDEVLSDLELSMERIEDQLDKGFVQIFESHRMMLQDPLLLRDLEETFKRELVNAEQVVKLVFKQWERKFDKIDDKLLSLPSEDIADLGRRILRSLTGLYAHTLENIPDGSILVSKRLYPSDTVFLSRKSVLGIILEHGGPASHAALLTRELGIPAVANIPDVLTQIAPEDMVFVDGNRGIVTIRPDKKAQRLFMDQLNRYQEISLRNYRHCHEPARTKDGEIIRVLANISCREDAEKALEMGADGVGLYRMEGLYLSRKIPPTEDDLFKNINHSLEPMKGKPCTVRLLDLGGDKEIPFLGLPLEPNPFLGRRGIRILLEYPDLVKPQLKAMMRLSEIHNIRILVPLVTLVSDMSRIRNIFDSVAKECGIKQKPPLGAMIETPASALCINELVEYSDFFSIGTNDLTQYTMAAGRENPLVNNYFVDDHPAIKKLLGMIVQNGGELEISICGELAGRKEMIPTIIKTGIRSLSIASPLIPMVKNIIRKTVIHGSL